MGDRPWRADRPAPQRARARRAGDRPPPAVGRVEGRARRHLQDARRPGGPPQRGHRPGPGPGDREPGGQQPGRKHRPPREGRACRYRREPGQAGPAPQAQGPGRGTAEARPRLPGQRRGPPLGQAQARLLAQLADAYARYAQPDAEFMAKRPIREPALLDQEGRERKQALEAVRQKSKQREMEIRRKNRYWWEKTLDLAGGWRVAGGLSHLSIVGKLTASAVTQLGTKFGEDVAWAVRFARRRCWAGSWSGPPRAGPRRASLTPGPTSAARRRRSWMRRPTPWMRRPTPRTWPRPS